MARAPRRDIECGRLARMRSPARKTAMPSPFALGVGSGFGRSWGRSRRTLRLRSLRSLRPARVEQEPTSGSSRRASRLRQREHVQRAALRGVIWQILRGTDETECAVGVARIEIAGHHRARPAAHARQHRDVFTPVGTAIRNWLAVDTRTYPELP